MTNEEMNLIIAERVMGWHKGEPKEFHYSRPASGWLVDEQGEAVMSVVGWQPGVIAAQALRALNEWRKKTNCFVEMRGSDVGWLVRIHKGHCAYAGEDEALEMAICLALAEAVRA